MRKNDAEAAAEKGCEQQANGHLKVFFFLGGGASVKDLVSPTVSFLSCSSPENIWGRPSEFK